MGIVLYHEFACDEGELISDEVERQRIKRPLLVISFIVTTAAHLIGVLNPKADPYTRAGVLFTKGN